MGWRELWCQIKIYFLYILLKTWQKRPKPVKFVSHSLSHDKRQRPIIIILVFFAYFCYSLFLEKLCAKNFLSLLFLLALPYILFRLYSCAWNIHNGNILLRGTERLIKYWFLACIHKAHDESVDVLHPQEFFSLSVISSIVFL